MSSKTTMFAKIFLNEPEMFNFVIKIKVNAGAVAIPIDPKRRELIQLN